MPGELHHHLAGIDILAGFGADGGNHAIKIGLALKVSARGSITKRFPAILPVAYKLSQALKIFCPFTQIKVLTSGR
jgi:hypothetical protein